MPSGRRRGRPWNDHRRTLEGIIWRYRTGSRGGICLRSSVRGSRSPTPSALVDRWHLRADLHRDLDGLDAEGDLLELLSVDSTSVRAHQHAAGARPVLAHTGDRSNYTNLPGEPDDHAIGRSRGGWTTKIHALTDQWCSPVRDAVVGWSRR